MLALICLPQVPVFFYGIFVDSVPIFNSRKRSYILIMSSVQVLSLLALIYVVLENKRPFVMVWLLGVSSFAYGVVDTVVDGLWVTQVRCDSKYGANDLLAFSWIWLSIGGITSSAAYAFFGYYHHYWAVYLLPLIGSLLLFVFAWYISNDIDGNAQLILDMNLRSRFQFTIKAIRGGLKLKQLRRVFYFYIILAIVTPNFDDFLDYFVNFGPI